MSDHERASEVPDGSSAPRGRAAAPGGTESLEEMRRFVDLMSGLGGRLLAGTLLMATVLGAWLVLRYVDERALRPLIDLQTLSAVVLMAAAFATALGVMAVFLGVLTGGMWEAFLRSSMEGGGDASRDTESGDSRSLATLMDVTA